MIFRKIQMDDYQDYHEHYKMCLESCSDNSFLSILELSFTHDVEIAFQEGFYWVKLDWNGELLWLPPVGDWDVDNWEELLTSLVPAGTKFGFIPVSLMKRWDALLGRMEVEEMREEWDYVYNMKKQVLAEGKEYKNWRKSINQFEKNYSYTFTPITVQDVPALLTFQDAWMVSVQGEEKLNEELLQEDQAFRKFMELWSCLKTAIGYILRVEEEIAAYVICENLNDFIISGRFTKHSPKYPAAAKFIKYLLYESLEDDYFLVNGGGDAALKGLRYAKMDENPITLYQKYKLCWKG